jgi:hypothetical protein
MNTKSKRLHYSFELADHLGVQMADLVGPENADKYPSNLFEARVLEAMQKLPEDQQEALAVWLGASLQGMIAHGEMDRIRQLAGADCLEQIVAWRATLTPEQVALANALPEKAAA